MPDGGTADRHTPPCVHPVGLNGTYRTLLTGSASRREAPRRVRARRIAAALVLAAGAVHLWLWFDYFHRVHVVGVLFLVNAATAAVVATALARSRRPIAAFAGMGYSAGTLTFFTLSVTVGLFGYHETLVGTWQVVAGTIEIGSLVALAPHVRR